MVALALVGLPSSAGAYQTTSTTFGANLAARAPQSTDTCATVYSSSDCTLTTNADQLGGTGETFLVPDGPDTHGTGTITAFHVSVGDQTGPMQILLLQALRQQQSSTASCCSVLDATAFFTPAANAITTVPVSWATEYDNVPNPDNGVFAFDLMAISVSPGVPLPVSLQTNASDTFWAPACPGTVGTECDVYGGDERYVVTMSADWTPNPVPGTTPTPTPKGPTAPAAPNLLPATASGVVKGNAVNIPLSCSTAACIGTVQLQNFEAHNGAADARKARHVTYAKLNFSLTAGQKKKVKLKLDKAGRALLAHRASVAVWLNFTLNNGKAFSRRFTLRR